MKRTIQKYLKKFLGIQSAYNGYELAELYRRKGVKIGKNTIFIPPIMLGRDGKDPIEIGSNCILTGCCILGHDASTNKRLNLFDGSLKQKVIIEDNVFIGFHAVVLMGVTIGCNSIVGAGTIVTKSFPENSVICGNPGRIICTTDDLVTKRQNLINESQQ